MKFIELTVHTTSEVSELIADIFWNYTNYGVSICDVNDIIALQRDKCMYWDYMDEALTEGAPKECLVKAFIAMDIADTTIPQISKDIDEMAERSREFFALGSLEMTKREIEGDDWIDIWKKHFRPLHIGSKIVVVPEWINYEKKEGEEIVRLDSNMAFGTGEHETTSMCLELLQKYLTSDSVCIDVGCGSGILGISAVKLGAKFAYLTDIDYVAVDSAKHNSSLNKVEEKIFVSHSNLLDNADIKGDIVLANITADILSMLAPSMPKNLKEEGTLILSGIIHSKLDLVISAFSAQGLHVIEKVVKGEWIALALKR